jgi:hypothetical protein
MPPAEPIDLTPQPPLPLAPAPPLPLSVSTQPVATQLPDVETPAAVTSAASAPGFRKKPRPAARGFSLPQPVKVVLGGLGGLAAGYLAVYLITGHDFLKIMPARPLAAGKIATARPRDVSTPTAPSESPGLQSTHGASGTSASPGSAASALPPQVVASPPPATLAVSASPSKPRPLPGTPDGATSPPAAARHPAPGVEAQQAMRDKLQSLFKSEFERGAKPDGQQEFLSFAMGMARKLQTDPVAKFVLYRESYDRAIQLDEFITAAEIIDELERSYEVDEYALRQHLLTEAARAAKTPDERLPLVDFALEMADHALATQRPDDVTRLANLADSLARNLSARGIKSQTASRTSQLRRAAQELDPVIAARAKLQLDPADAAASLIEGKYRCFAQGNWAAGLALLAQSSDSATSDAAKLDLAAAGGDRPAAIAAGDAWFDLAEGNGDLAPAFARARHWYASAVNSAEGLERIKLERRIEQIDALNLPPPSAAKAADLPGARILLTGVSALEPTNVLLALSAQTVRSQGWTLDTNQLCVEGPAARARLPSPVQPRGDYQVELAIVRSQRQFGASAAPAGTFVVGLPSGKSQCLVVLDFPVAGRGFASFLTLSGYRKLEDNPTLTLSETVQPRLAEGRASEVVCQMKSDEIAVLIGGEKVIEYRGDMGRLMVPPEWAVPSRRSIFLGAHQGGFCVTGWTLAPLTSDPARELTRP